MWILTWIEKLIDGVLELETPIGPRYVQPNFAERLVLIWTFRNFISLPQQVLRPRERRLVDRLWSESRFVPVRASSTDRPIIGRIERRAPTHAEVVALSASPLRKPVSRSASAAVDQNRDAASA
jgi:hypothetical protein